MYYTHIYTQTHIYKQISTYKPTGNLIYNSNLLQRIENTVVEKKTWMIILNYAVC